MPTSANNQGVDRLDAKVKSYAPIDCEDYDYLELICLDQYEVELVTETGRVRGLAVTIKNHDKGEYLIVELNNNQRESVRIDHIRQIIVLSEQRRFDEHTFKPRIDPK